MLKWAALGLLILTLPLPQMLLYYNSTFCLLYPPPSVLSSSFLLPSLPFAREWPNNNNRSGSNSLSAHYPQHCLQATGCKFELWSLKNHRVASMFTMRNSHSAQFRELPDWIEQVLSFLCCVFMCCTRAY